MPQFRQVIVDFRMFKLSAAWHSNRQTAVGWRLTAYLQQKRGSNEYE